jgi:cytidine deaminase
MLKAITALSPVYQAAAALAVKVSANSYSPYSEFCVGAVFVHPDDSLTAGCNFENCTFQATCAERCAMVAANANGKRAAVAVAVYGASSKPGVVMPADAVCPPCGLCRQHLNEVAELSGADLDLILVAGDRKRARVCKLSELLPLPFGPASFGVDLTRYKPKAAAAGKRSSAPAAGAAGAASKAKAKAEPKKTRKQ